MNLQFNTGVDVGNGYTKYQGGRFASKIKTGSLSRANVNNNSEVHQIVFEDKNYIIGDESAFSFMSENRYFEKYYLISLLTAIALSSGIPSGTIKTNVVIGVPVDDFNRLSDKITEHFSNLEPQKISVDGHEYVIEIKKLTVFIEGGNPIATQNNEHVITIDIGAGTLNIIEWKNQEIMNKFTINGAFRKLLKEIVEYANDKYGTKLQINQAEKLIGQKTMNTLHGKVDISELDEKLDLIINDYVSTIRDSFSVDLCDSIQICGGAAKNTFEFWKKYLPKAELVDEAQFANQRVYQAVANSIYGK